MRQTAVIRLLCLLALGSVSMGSTATSPAAQPGPPLTPDKFFLRASHCAVVHRAQALFFVQAAAKRSDDPRPAVLREVELGLSFAGTAYKLGLRQPLADHLLAQAEGRVNAMNLTTFGLERLSCVQEAQILWDRASRFERLMASGRASLGADKLIAEPGLVVSGIPRQDP